MITRPTENFLMRHASAIAIFTVTFIMVTYVLIFLRQVETSDIAISWVEHTHETIEHIGLLSSKLKDAELGERSYLLTGNEEFLEPYNEAIRDSAFDPATLPAIHSSVRVLDTDQAPHNLPHKINSLNQHMSIGQEIMILKWLTADNSAQQENLNELNDVITMIFKHWSDNIQVQKNRSTAAGKQETYLSRSKQLMDHARIMTRVMEGEEMRLLAIRNEANAAAAHQNKVMILIGIALLYLIKVFGIWIYQRTRAKAQAKILHYAQELERGEEELKVQQEELKASNEEIEASNEELEEKTRALEKQNAQIQLQSEKLAESKRLIEEKAMELARASKYKSEFLANMSHELRTPLNSLLILAKMLAANEDGNLTDAQVEEARIIYNGGLELLELINDILDLSKVEAGKLSIIPEDTSLDGIVRRIQQQFAPVTKESGVAFPVIVAEDLPATLHTDAQRVEQILKNLLSNAFKFTERGSVTLKVCRPDTEIALQRASLERKDVIAFSVIDTGIGIETSKFKDIFEAFQQEDGSIDRHYGGTGLGLTIARKFAHMLGGEIHVASEKGKGSAFTLVLPVTLEADDNTDRKAPADNTAETARIEIKTLRTSVVEFIADDRKNVTDKDKVLLIIEDDQNFASTLVRIAHRHGYKALAAGDGKTGLLFAMEQKVTAIILDLKLPDMDGMQVLEQLKHDLRTRHIPVHIISGREESDTIVPLRKGAIGYLTKPVRKEEIDGVFTRIEELLQSDIKHILLVEDDKTTQVAVQSLLKKQDVDIATADKGHTALEMIRGRRFDCIILDLRLPDMTGFEWLEKMEKQAEDKNALPPVIVYTAKELTEEENRELSHYTGSIIIKGVKSSERLLDEVTLFLHSIEATLSKEQQEVIRMQHNPDKVLHGRTILLTDDDLRNTFALSKLLKGHGMNVVIADNGQMALEKLKGDKSIELVIMDIMMPVMDGYQTIREIRMQKPYQALPIIALTARAMPEEQERCMAAGANDYLTKPVDIERLLTLLRVCLFRQEIAA